MHQELRPEIQRSVKLKEKKANKGTPEFEMLQEY